MLRTFMDMNYQETADPYTPPTSAPTSSSPPTKLSTTYKHTRARKPTSAPLTWSSHIHDRKSKVAIHGSFSCLGTSAYWVRELVTTLSKPRIRPSNQPCPQPRLTLSTSSSFDLSSSKWPSLQQSLTLSLPAPYPPFPRPASGKPKWTSLFSMSLGRSTTYGSCSRHLIWTSFPLLRHPFG